MGHYRRARIVPQLRFTGRDAVAIRRRSMRITIVGVAALVAVGRAAVAGSILYATAATHGGVDSFCLARDGSLTPTPKQNVQTAGATPRRLLIAPNALGGQTLYVAEADRIEAFPIMPGGALKSPSQTKPVASLDPRDLAFAPPEPP